MHNPEVRIQTRAGQVVYTNSLRGFWSKPNILPLASILDPRVLYDPFYDRWIATATVDAQSSTSAVVVAVSTVSNPTNNNDWKFTRVKADPNSLLWADQPTIGFNKDWIVVQANMFGTNGVVEASYLFVFNKTNFYSSDTNAPSVIRLFHNDPDSAGGERPAVTYDTNLAELYLIQNADGNFNGTEGRLRLFSISGNVDAPTLNYLNTNEARYIVVSNSANETVTWANILSTNLALWQRCCAPQKDTDIKIGTVSSAQIDTVVYRNGFLWCAQTVFLPADNPSRTAVQWWQISPHNTNVIQRGRIDGGINFYAFGSIGVNRFNDALIGYSSFSTNQYASAGYSFRHFYMQINDTLPPHTFKEGEDIWSLGRWGDYSATVVDRVNDTDLWTIQQYARLDTNYPTFAWGTWWAQVLVPVPTNDHFSAALTISDAAGSTNGSNLRATREPDEPAHGGHTNTPSVWFSWTAPTNGPVVFSVTRNRSYGAPFDSVLAVYEGLSLSSLTTNASHHGGPSSQVIFDAEADTTYMVAVAGFYGTMGDFTLTWEQSMPPLFCRHPLDDQPDPENRATNVIAGEQVTFESLAIGNPAPTYQWLTNQVPIPSATNANYTLVATTNLSGSVYSVMASNVVGTALSSNALLVVHDAATAKITNAVLNGAGDLVIHVHGVTNRPYIVETTTNLNSPIQWSAVHTNYVSFNYTNLLTSNDWARFYRVLAGEIQ